ncbi:MAG: hypothetical protein NC095_10920 [Muribaculum sp.]|nr:hypothetical protein [Muribaculum sp.]
MKKLLYLLLVLPFAMIMASCNDDDDLPNVTVTMDFGNAAAQDGTLYVVQTDTLMLNNIVTKAIDSNQSAVLANVRYYWNYVPAPYLTWSPLPMEIPIAQMPLTESGNNLLQMDATLLETDKSIGYTNIAVPIKVVPTIDEMPAAPGDVQLVLTIGQSKEPKTTSK